MGNSLVAREKTGDAIAAFRAAIEHNPEYCEAHLAVGTAIAKTGNMAEARRHWQKAAVTK